MDLIKTTIANLHKQAWNPNTAQAHRKANDILLDFFKKQGYYGIINDFNELVKNGNYSIDNHRKADDLLVKRLTELKQFDIIDTFQKVDRIYN